MKFDEKYPEAQIGFEPKDLFIFKSGMKCWCMVCEEKTKWISIPFETYVCSEECLDALWKEYDQILITSSKNQVCNDS